MDKLVDSFVAFILAIIFMVVFCFSLVVHTIQAILVWVANLPIGAWIFLSIVAALFLL